MNRRAAQALILMAQTLLTLAGEGRADDGLEVIVPGLTVIRGPVNGAILQRAGKRLAIYGDPRESPQPVDTVLFTHHRRDAVWAGRALVASGSKAVVPEAELDSFSEVSRFWRGFQQKRFHDYTHSSTKALAEPLPVSESVRGGQIFSWEGLPIRVIDARGYTPGAVAYLVEMEGKRIAFTGDLLHGDGKLLDIYSFQDAIPEVGIGGYHGFGARLAEAIASLRAIADENPDIIVPARGTVIRNPRETVEQLVSKVRALYANYLSIDAHRYYSGEERFAAKARRVLGPDTQQLTGLIQAETKDLPDWIVPIDNSRLILSADGAGLLVDCGSRHIIEELEKLQKSGRLKRIEHVFVTHYHDDHTDQLSELVAKTGATVHATRANWEILENPGSYRMPCLTANPVHVSGRDEDGAHWRWKEFDLTIRYFPGQTLNHDALLVRRETGEEVFFIGDSFTPTGIDDYCAWNRNLLHEGRGYPRCLEIIDEIAGEALLINQHVRPMFRFSAEQRETMKKTLEARFALLKDLLPWDDPNYGLDESWARFHPYSLTVRAGTTAVLALRLFNHSPAEQSYQVKLNLPKGWAAESLSPNPIRLPAHAEGSVEMRIGVDPSAGEGLQIVTADLRWGAEELREWTEAMVIVEAGDGP